MMVRGIIKLIAVIGLWFFLCATASAGVADVDRSGDEDSYIAAVKELNKQLPIMTDQETRLDGVLYTAKTFIYKGTLINYHSGQFTEEGNEVFGRHLYEHRSLTLCPLQI